MLWKTFEKKKSVFLAIAIMGAFRLDEKSEPVKEKDLWEVVQKDLDPAQVLDPGMPKPKSEVLVAGKACQPDGKPGPALDVSIRVGSLRKHLYVFGNRQWKRVAGTVRTPSDPENFAEMTLSWSNAYGGEGYDKNPLGKGYGDVLSETGEKIHLLPNIEDPKSLVVSLSSRPDPAGFGPLEPHWPQRIGKAGTYNSKWLNDSWPYFPEDMDWTWFNAAPADQWLDGYFKGDEPIEIVHMHPQISRMESRLPGFRARCFILRKQTDGGEILKEVKTYLETVWLFPNSQVGVAVHRGITEVTDDEAEDVEYLLAEWESLAEERKPIDYYRELFQKKTARVPEEEQAEEPPLPAPEGEPVAQPAPPVPPPAAPPDSEEDEEDQWAAGQIARAERNLKARLRNAGLNPDKLLNPDPPPGAAAMDENAVDRKIWEQFGRAEEQIDRMLEKEGMDRETLLKKMAEKPAATDAREMLGKTADAYPAEYFPAIEAMLNQMLAAGQKPEPPAAAPPQPPPIRDQIQTGFLEGRSLAGKDLSGQDLSHLELTGLDLKGAILVKTDFTGSDLTSADLSESNMREAVFQKTILRSANLSHAFGRSAIFTEADMTGVDLNGTDLKAARMDGATLQSASMKETRADGASMIDATLTEADFTKAHLTGTDLSQARLVRTRMVRTSSENAVLAQADLSEADLSESDFTGADFTNASLVQADMTGAYLEGAVLTHCDLSRIKAAGTIFTGADCSHSLFAEALLDQADFSRARLDRTDFSQAGAVAACFGDARGEKVTFTGADLTRVQASGQTCLAGAQFTKADLTATTWGEADLSEADFTGVTMEKADFTKCNLQKAVFKGVRAREASFLKADLTAADLSRADLFQCNFRKAKMMNADFKGANLFMADFYRATLGNTDFREADLKRTLLAEWRPS